MFRRSKPQHIAPAAPTFEQILEDLETFEVERPEHKPTRTLEKETSASDNTSNTSSQTDVDDDDSKNSSGSANPEHLMAQWLRTFATFRADVQELHRLRRQLQLCTADLSDQGQAIADELKAIERRVSDALQT